MVLTNLRGVRLCWRRGVVDFRFVPSPTLVEPLESADGGMELKIVFIGLGERIERLRVL